MVVHELDHALWIRHDDGEEPEVVALRREPGNLVWRQQRHGNGLVFPTTRHFHPIQLHTSTSEMSWIARASCSLFNLWTPKCGVKRDVERQVQTLNALSQRHVVVRVDREAAVEQTQQRHRRSVLDERHEFAAAEASDG